MSLPAPRARRSRAAGRVPVPADEGGGEQIWQQRIAASWAIVAVGVLLLAVAETQGQRRVIAVIGLVRAAVSVTRAVRHHRPADLVLWRLVVALCGLYAISTTAFPWRPGETHAPTPWAFVVLIPITAILPWAALIVMRPYLRSAVTWRQVMPTAAMVVVVCSVIVGSMIGDNLHLRVTAAVMAATHLAGFLTAWPMMRQLGRTTDATFYLATGGLPLMTLLVAAKVPGAFAIGEFVTASVIVVAAWHPSMRLAGQPLSIGSDPYYREHRTTAITAFTVIPLVGYAVAARHDWYAYAAVAMACLVAVVHGAWSIATGRVSTTDLRLRYGLRRAIVRRDITPSYQVIHSTGGTPLGSMIWARWSHRRLGVLTAADWWDLGRRQDLAGSAEAVVLRAVAERAAAGDLGVVVVTLDDPRPHAPVLGELARRCTLVVRCDTGFDVVRAAGGRVATSLDLALIARPEVVVLPAAVVVWAATVQGRDAIAAAIATARRLGAMTLAEGAETRDAVLALEVAGVDMISGYGVGRPTPAATPA